MYRPPCFHHNLFHHQRHLNHPTQHQYLHCCVHSRTQHSHHPHHPHHPHSHPPPHHHHRHHRRHRHRRSRRRRRRRRRNNLPFEISRIHSFCQFSSVQTMCFPF